MVIKYLRNGKEFERVIKGKARKTKKYSRNDLVYALAHERALFSCETCNGSTSLGIHHKDGVHENHSLDNVIVLCWPCHRAVHNKRLQLLS